ncbi:MAG: alpha-N-arabinofuranosidase [Candidatus Omnitrophota bacterium]|jgi:alpha-N-arabinofuranosidase|nr:MAG: alpha-N-arabinofuranosidase [Candidatus Omnitrophota bacterium]
MLKTRGAIVPFVFVIFAVSLFPPPQSIGADSSATTKNQLVVHADQGAQTINRNIYGHFAEHLGWCIYGGIWVGEDSPIPNTRGIRKDIVEALKRIEIPVLRWPGGCFADEYHWMDGIGPKEKRPPMVNTHWGMVTENNHFGTHEFLDLCEQLECESYISGNVGSGSVLEMQQWVEYITFAGNSPMANLRRQNGREEPWKIKYWGVGNENWGCGGNMTPEFYADLYLRFQTYVRNFSGNRIYKIACGSYGERYDWTEVLMKKAGRHMNGLSLHYYCGSGKNSRSATKFEEEDWFEQIKRALMMEDILTAHSAIMDKFDPDKKVGMMVDEWGAWHAVEPGTNRGFLYQQNSLRDALVAGLTLNILNQHCDRVQMANIAQTINVLQAMVLTDKERMILTPTYHVFDLYKVHQDATLLPTDLQCADYAFGGDKIPALNVSASKKSGKIHVTLCNFDPNHAAELNCALSGVTAKSVSGQILTADQITSHNTIEKPDVVKPVSFHAASIKDGNVQVTLPAKSVVLLTVE